MEEPKGLPQIPKTWLLLTVGDIIDKPSLTDKKLPQKNYQSQGKVPVIDQGSEFIGGYTNQEELKVVCELPVIVFGDHTKAIKFVSFEFVAGADGVKVLKPYSAFDPKLFYYFLKGIQLPDKGYARHFQYLEKSIIPLPPLPEQQRIVAKIEELFTRLDAGIDALKDAKKRLKRYRQSVLKAAVEGELTKAWREQHKEISRAALPVFLHTPNLSQKRAGRLWGSGVVPDLTKKEASTLPEGWIWLKVRNLGINPDEVVQVGPMSMKSKDFESSGIPVLNVGCVKWGYFDESKLDFMPEEKALAFSRYRIKAKDILFTRSGTVGRCAIAKPHQEGWLMTFHLLRVRTDASICLPEYLRMVFEGAPHIERQIQSAAIGTTRAGFNTNLLAMLDIPLPTLIEQRQIVAEVERRLSVSDEIHNEIEANLKRAERLRQSILKRAFEGKLVPQNPDDEPASVLLERIKAERDSQTKTPTPKSKRKVGGNIPAKK